MYDVAEVKLSLLHEGVKRGASVAYTAGKKCGRGFVLYARD